MLIRAAADLGLDLTRSLMIGDRDSDLRAGATAGCRTALVRTGYGEETSAAIHLEKVRGLGVFDTVAEAVQYWLETPQSS
jgi:D-glycero-D-manno-heptose 1,7-bisphosphate phosphatase